MDCTPTPTVVCELSRIADSLTDKTPTGFEWLQLVVTTLAAAASIVVAVFAVLIAGRSHQLAEASNLDNARRLEAERRNEFSGRAQAVLDTLLTVAREGAALDATTRLSSSALVTESLSTGDDAQMALATQIGELRQEMSACPPGESMARFKWQIATLKIRVAFWVLMPTIGAMSPEEWDALAREIVLEHEGQVPAESGPSSEQHV